MSRVERGLACLTETQEWGECFAGAYATYGTYVDLLDEEVASAALPELCGLAGAFQHGLPEFALGVDFAATVGREGDREMYEGAVPASDEEVGLSGHSGVDGVPGELGAVDVVLSVRWNGTDDVAWVDVFQADIDFAFLEETVDVAAKAVADVAQFLVAAGVGRVASVLE